MISSVQCCRESRRCGAGQIAIYRRCTRESCQYILDRFITHQSSCGSNHLIYPPIPSASSTASSGAAAICTSAAKTLHLSSPPYENYFYSDCHTASQIVITSPEPDSNLTIIGPRLLVAWPAGNSGIAAYFEPENGINGTLSIQLLNSTIGSPLGPVYDATGGNATVGVSAQLELNSSAILSVSILGSIRTIRDFVEGPSLLRNDIQSAITYSTTADGVELRRLWLDNTTTTTVSFTSPNNKIQIDNTTLKFDAGTYTFSASFDYPQLTQLSSQEVLNPESTALITQSPMQTTSLSFLSYTTKLTAGAWRFLTYFGRDSMISALLLQPVLSEGKGGAIEAVIAGVLERINMTDGSVCHEETIGYCKSLLENILQLTVTVIMRLGPICRTISAAPLPCARTLWYACFSIFLGSADSFPD